MRTIIFVMLLALTPAVFAGGSGGMGSESITRSFASSGNGGYTDPKLIVHYPLQQGLMLYKITAFKYGW